MDIVWAEDSGADQFLIQSVLDEVDPALQVAFASDGPAALRLVQRHAPAVVVLDVRMPGLSGIEVLRRLRRDPATAASNVVVFTSTTEARDLGAVRDLGALACVQKPTDLEAFRVAVRAIARQALEARLQEARSHRPAARGTHHVLFWDSEPGLVEAAHSFIEDGLRRGHGAIVLATPEHLARLRRDLAGQDVVWLDTDAVRRQVRSGSRYDIARFEQILGQARATASRGGKRPVTCFGELVAVLQAQGEDDAAAALETVGQRAAAAEPDGIFILCAYPVTAFGTSHALERACLVHTNHAWPSRPAPMRPGPMRRAVAALAG